MCAHFGKIHLDPNRFDGFWIGYRNDWRFTSLCLLFSLDFLLRVISRVFFSSRNSIGYWRRLTGFRLKRRPDCFRFSLWRSPRFSDREFSIVVAGQLLEGFLATTCLCRVYVVDVVVFNCIWLLFMDTIYLWMRSIDGTDSGAVFAAFKFLSSLDMVLNSVEKITTIVAAQWDWCCFEKKEAPTSVATPYVQIFFPCCLDAKPDPCSILHLSPLRSAIQWVNKKNLWPAIFASRWVVESEFVPVATGDVVRSFSGVGKKNWKSETDPTGRATDCFNNIERIGDEWMNLTENPCPRLIVGL